MSKIVIIGAGAMGTAFALPCLDNNHDTSIVGTHLENDFIEPSIARKTSDKCQKIFEDTDVKRSSKENIDVILNG